MNEDSLVRLIRRNWVNIFSIKSIINNIANPNGDLKTFQFGKDSKADQLFLQRIRTNLPARFRQQLGILSISDEKLLNEMKIINKGIIDGSPKIEITEICDNTECFDEVVVPGKECPEQEIIEDVSIEYIETCSTSELVCPPQPPPRETPCSVDDCIAFAQKECDLISKVTKTGYILLGF